MQQEADRDKEQQKISQLGSNLSQFHPTSVEDAELTTNSNILQSEIISNPFLRQYILLGYAAKGVVYFLIGILAIEAVILPERKAAGTYKALKHLSGQPLGSVILCLLAVGILGYVLRRLLQAIVYPGHSQGFSPQGILQRSGYILSSLSYAGVAYSALSIVLHLGKYNDHIKDAVEKLFEQPIAGEGIVFIAGIGVTGVGIGYLYGAYTGSYISQFTSSEIDPRLEYCARWMGKIGIAARGIAFIITGICLVISSLVSNSDIAGGLQNAFQVLAAQPLGWLWLGLIGSGFIAYGLYMFVASRYRLYAIR
ncbi:DUF1206 domain-containing protein [Pleurocapsales cyanobacterium LEGE 10410]|nr:DUF1206 domain-containing protein [Pleurocapsales cyanobacterium LEGE 10410]